MIRAAYVSDAEAIVAIYNHYIGKSVATFEAETIDSVEMAERIGKVTRAGLPWIVEEAGGEIRGYAYAGPWNSRAAYKRTAEVTIYIAPSAVSSDVGTQLYTDLFSRLLECRIHCAIAGITLPNPPSVAIHEKFGMRKSGEFNEVAYKFGKWLDVGYWTVQLSA